MNRVLITGTAGFIGFHLVKKFIHEGIEVDGIDSINDYYDQKLKYARLRETGIEESKIDSWRWVESNRLSGYRFMKGDLCDRERIEEIFNENNYDQVIHLAAQAGVRYSIDNPHAYVQSNLVGFVNILEACKRSKVSKILYASSSSVYGNKTSVPFCENDRVDNPISLYAATKKSNELIAHVYSHLFDIQTIGLRFFTVYGPWGRPDMAPMLFADAAKEGRVIKVFNYGKQERDFTYIDDIVNGIILCSKKEINDKYLVLNIGKGSPVKLMDFIAQLESCFNKIIDKKFVESQPGDVSRTFASVVKLQEVIDYKPKVSLKEGVERFVNWYNSFY